MNRILLSVVTGLLLAANAAAVADQAAPLGDLAKMPIREITVFKDGHAFVLHAGKMPTDGSGDVVLNYLPTPVMGTFWPYSSDKKAKLTAVTTGARRVTVERATVPLRQLLAANVGNKVIVEMNDGQTHTGRIISLPQLGSAEFKTDNPPNTAEVLPAGSNLVLLMTDSGTEALAIDDIRDLRFPGPHKGMTISEEFRNLLTLKLDWSGKDPEKTADVGMLYLQRGVRWIPQYKISIDGHGKATVKLQATLLNELADVEDVTCHLVIGVPTFAFKDTLDPIALQNTLANLSSHFREESQTARGLSNAIMSQVGDSRSRLSRPAARPGADPGPEIGLSERTEDMFVFTVEHLTLKKGQRMVLPIAEFTLPYKDVYTLNIPFAPPPEVLRNFNHDRQAQLARLLAAPKVMHKIRLTNKSKYPLTTAPALILRGNRLLAQNMMTYTSIGGETDLAITTAVDIRVKKTDRETRRTQNAITWRGDKYLLANLEGVISLTNFRAETVDLEIVRGVLGNVGEADHDGKAEMVNMLEDTGLTGRYSRPHWWGWYNWPHWWRHFNGVGRISWKLSLEPGKSVDLKYTWNYYWR